MYICTRVDFPLDVMLTLTYMFTDQSSKTVDTRIRTKLSVKSSAAVFRSDAVCVCVHTDCG